MKTIITLVTLFSILHVNAQHVESSHAPEINKLLDDFKCYTTTMTNFHAGDLYQHSIWVANTIAKWWEENKFWVENISKNDQRLTILAGLLHDIGKAGDQKFIYENKSPHPRVGFEYVLGTRPYLPCIGDQPWNFNNFFNALSISPEEKQIIDIAIGMHWDLGGMILSQLQKDPSKKDYYYDQYLTKLRCLAQEVGYHNGAIDLRLIRICLLVSAADVFGVQKVEAPYSIFNLGTPEEPHGPVKDRYYSYLYDDTGHTVRDELVKYFTESQAVLSQPINPELCTKWKPS